MNKYLTIDFSNPCDIAPLFLSEGWAGRIILDAELAETQEDLFEEGEEDGEFNFFPSFQRCTKRYTLETGFISENTAEALERLKLFSTVEITLKTGEKAQMHNIEVESSYPFVEATELLATITFDLDEMLIKTTCCNDMERVTITLSMWSVYGCEEEDGENTGYLRAKTLTVDKTIGGTSITDYPKAYNITSLFEWDSTEYPSLTDQQLLELSLTDYNDRLTDFLLYVADIEGVLNVINDARDEDVVECPLPTYCIAVEITRNGGDQVSGTVRTYKTSGAVLVDTENVNSFDNPVEFDVTGLTLENHYITLTLGLLDSGNLISSKVSWSLDGINYTVSNQTSDIMPSSECTKLYVLIEAL